MDRKILMMTLAFYAATATGTKAFGQSADETQEFGPEPVSAAMPADTNFSLGIIIDRLKEGLDLMDMPDKQPFFYLRSGTSEVIVPIYSIVDGRFLELIDGQDPQGIIDKWFNEANQRIWQHAYRDHQPEMKYRIMLSHQGIIDTLLKERNEAGKLETMKMISVLEDTYRPFVIYFTGHTLVEDTKKETLLKRQGIIFNKGEGAFDEEGFYGTAPINGNSGILQYRQPVTASGPRWRTYPEEVYPLIAHELIHNFGPNNDENDQLMGGQYPYHITSKAVAQDLGKKFYTDWLGPVNHQRIFQENPRKKQNAPARQKFLKQKR
ncbi:hypothetical protein J4227_07685 [Candidatus Woesearchaeota archaeon]|nr:hypothetical protein [Candidatus Woesearchaeota archaeon]